LVIGLSDSDPAIRQKKSGLMDNHQAAFLSCFAFRLNRDINIIASSE